MFTSSQPTDAKTHDTAVAIARRCVGIIETILRPEEVQECLREFYAAARLELDKKEGA